MVIGLDRFKNHFAKFKDCYVLIGGTACDLAIREAGLEFRATKDLDIVLCIEVIDEQFVAAFWQFIKEGGYENQQKSTGKKLFYRFYGPKQPDYPRMLELFSRKPEAIKLKDDSHLTPIPIDDAISSLSAILLDKDYYDLLSLGKREIESLSVLSHEYLIPLKARACNDLSQRQEADSKDIRKHKNDVLRLYQLLSNNQRIQLPKTIKNDLQFFLDNLKNDEINLKDIDIRNTQLEEIISNLCKIYEIEFS